MSDQFKALIVNQEGENFTREVKSIDKSFLKHGDVTVQVDYSDLNFKDGMILKNGGRLVKEFPHIPGIDFSGTVLESENSKFKTGDEVILTGFRVGEVFYGGYSQVAKVNGEFLVKKPKNLTTKQAMILGTAGFTSLMSAFAIKAREEILLGEKVNNVLVSGATGGVGSIAVIALSKMGYNVTAMTGKDSKTDYLKSLGAKVFAIGVEPNGLNIKKAHIIGNSLGGIVGGYLAAQHSDRIHRYVTIGGLGMNLFSPFPCEGLNLLTDFVEDPSREKIIAWLRSMVFDQSMVTEELINTRMERALEAKTLATSRMMYSRETQKAMAAVFRGPDATARIAHLGSITVPTLVTWGRDDRVTPVDMALLPMRLIPNAELHIFPNCGHWAMIERKQEFESVTLAFLQR